MTEYLITGGAGFIGSHMTEYLDDMGCDVIVTDIKKPVYLNKHPNVKFIKSDLTDKKSLENVVKNADVIFHTAAIFNFFASKDLLYDVNVNGTDNLCEVARKNGIKKIINWSSGAIYGNVYGNIRAKEYFQPYPKGNYCKSKWEAELKAFEHHGKDDLDVTTIRPAAVYGPGSAYGDAQALYLLKKGILCIKPGLKYTVSSHVHVEDVVRAAFFLSKIKNKTAKKPSDIAYNIADDQSIENHELIKKAAELMTNKGLLRFYDIKIPGVTIKISAYLIEKFAKIIKKNPLFETEGVSLLLDGHAMNNHKIKSLGFEFLYSNILDELENVIKWYEDNDWKIFKK